MAGASSYLDGGAVPEGAVGAHRDPHFSTVTGVGERSRFSKRAVCRRGATGLGCGASAGMRGTGGASTGAHPAPQFSRVLADTLVELLLDGRSLEVEFRV